MTFIISWNWPKKDKELKVMKFGPNWLGPEIKEHNKRRYKLVDLSKVWLGRSEEYKKQQEERFWEKI